MQSGILDRFRRMGWKHWLAGAAVSVVVFGSAPGAARAAGKAEIAQGGTVHVDPAAKDALLKRLWGQKLYLNLEGETIAELLVQIKQQTWARMNLQHDLAYEPLTAFADGCTFGDLRDGLADLFGFTITPTHQFESIIFHLTEPPAVRRAALSDGPAPARKPGVAKAVAAPLKPHLVAATKPDAELLKPLIFPKDLSPIEDADLFLPAMQQRLARIAGIRILSDYADRTEESLGTQSAEAFFRGLDGLPLGEALDKIAARFDYTWRKSHGWYLFRSRTWKAERKERINEAEAAEEEEEEPTPRIRP